MKLAAPAKFTLDVVTVTQRVVDLPARCPGCETDLSARNALQVNGWMAVTQNARLSKGGLEWEESYKDHFELQYQEEVLCHLCHMTLSGPPLAPQLARLGWTHVECSRCGDYAPTVDGELPEHSCSPADR
jgi:hypothetical protein